MADIMTILSIALGVLLSVLLPSCMRIIRDAQRHKGELGLGSHLKRIWKQLVWPYLRIALASLVIAVVVYLIVRVVIAPDSPLNEPLVAVWYGYTWDATIQRINDAR